MRLSLHSAFSALPLVGTLLAVLTLGPLIVRADMRLVRMAGQETGPWLKFANGHLEQGAQWTDSLEFSTEREFPNDASVPYHKMFLMKSEKGREVAECTVKGPGRRGVVTSFQVGHVPGDILTALGMPGRLAIGMCGCYAGHCIKCTSRRTGQGLHCVDSIQGPAKKECVGKDMAWSRNRAGKESWPGW